MNTTINTFDPTPGLKSSPVPVLFIPFMNIEDKCNYCGSKFTMSLKFGQKYCRNCLYWYNKCTKDNNTYLDTYISTNEYVRQVTPFNAFRLLSGPYVEWTKILEHCQDHYRIYSGWVESTLTKKSIPILYLPWWDNISYCLVCDRYIIKYIKQESEFYCQKWCSNCFTIYSGCRYCLTTNIIFGITDQSQCKKCKRISVINVDITNNSSGNFIIDEFLHSARINNDLSHLIADYMNNNTNPSHVYEFIYRYVCLNQYLKLIPYSQIDNLTKIAEGGFSTIYKATWSGKDVAIKKLRDSQSISKYFLNELKSFCQLNTNIFVIDCYGITQDPVTKEYMFIMSYANDGDLHNYLKKNFINITWTKKISIVLDIIAGLKKIHDKNIIHRDIHSGNILLSTFWKIGDLGLSQPANNSSTNNEIYGVIPYIAPEIFKGDIFSNKSDVYSLGMIMWELTTGIKPFANVEHDVNLVYQIIDGKRPEITSDTPECFANLMKKCWDSNPSRRPTVDEIFRSANKLNSMARGLIDVTAFAIFEQAEKKRLELIQSKKLGHEFSEKSHPKAIFTSRALSSLIYNSSTINTPIISLNIKQEYITKEHNFDIDINNINNIQSSTSQNVNFAAQYQDGITRPLSTMDFSRKRDIEELEIDTQNDRRRIKTNPEIINDHNL
ncbi:hypothetical protein RclHR1_07480009 [Rhizophagus clarus]|uniref:Kinase-like domain-containing protein n=1 Tax=Rhizophagus clarus TaxID=94130 RepID=A0A2Z6SLH2_9GLOM|nr:hypothetical protein RclHR1_07480009 [Rhizophagus clarus]GES79163.1 kinase-like domain-containing protein [Rhizophagus clarus]